MILGVGWNADEWDILDSVWSSQSEQMGLRACGCSVLVSRERARELSKPVCLPFIFVARLSAACIAVVCLLIPHSALFLTEFEV